MTRSQNASFHQTYESAQITCDLILWAATRSYLVVDSSSASLVRLVRPRESSPLLIGVDGFPYLTVTVFAVDGKSNFDGIFTAVTQHDGKFSAVDGYSFLDGNFGGRRCIKF